MVMGDIVLLEDQVNPVMSVALTNGLEVTALHNHFFWDTPKVMFMHIGGMGNEDTLAGAVGKVFATLKETSGGKGTVPHAELDPAKTSLDPKPIEEILGVKGQMASGVYKVTIGRTTTMHGHEVGNAMGVNTWAAFVGSDDDGRGRRRFCDARSRAPTRAQSVTRCGHQCGGDSSAYDHGVPPGDVSALLGGGPDTGTGHGVESCTRHATALIDMARGGTARAAQALHAAQTALGSESCHHTQTDHREDGQPWHSTHRSQHAP